MALRAYAGRATQARSSGENPFQSSIEARQPTDSSPAHRASTCERLPPGLTCTVTSNTRGAGPSAPTPDGWTETLPSVGGTAKPGELEGRQSPSQECDH